MGSLGAGAGQSMGLCHKDSDPPETILEWAVLGQVLASHRGCATRTAIRLANIELTVHIRNHPVVCVLRALWRPVVLLLVRWALSGRKGVSLEPRRSELFSQSESCK